MPIIVQKSGFLASSATVDLSVHFNKKAGAGFFGGEGFILQKLSGYGTAFVEIDGYCSSITLHPVSRLLLIQATLLQWMHLVKWTSSVLRVLRICSSEERVCLIQLLQARAESSYSRTQFLQ